MGAGAATIIGALIGAATGDAKAQEQKRENDKANKIEALKTLYSPWRNEKGEYTPGAGQIGQIADGMMAGAAMGQGMPPGGKAPASISGQSQPAGNMVMQSSQNSPSAYSSPTAGYMSGNMSTGQYLGQPSMAGAMSSYNPYDPNYTQSPYVMAPKANRP